MNRKLRPTRSNQQTKEEQINILLQDAEKNVDEYKRAIELKDKQLSDIKKILQGAKESYDAVIKENTELKKHIENIKAAVSKKKKEKNKNTLTRKKNTLGKKNQKNIKK